MTVSEVKGLLDAEIVTSAGNLELEVSSGFVGDLLSVVMGKASEDCAWITIQSHLNIIGVGSLIGVGCIIVTEGFKVDGDAIAKANEEEIPVMCCKHSSYKVASILAKNGL